MSGPRPALGEAAARIPRDTDLAAMIDTLWGGPHPLVLMLAWTLILLVTAGALTMLAAAWWGDRKKMDPKSWRNPVHVLGPMAGPLWAGSALLLAAVSADPVIGRPMAERAGFTAEICTVAARAALEDPHPARVVAFRAGCPGAIMIAESLRAPEWQSSALFSVVMALDRTVN